MQYNLTIVIPSLNEEWLGETLKDVLKNSNEETEIIVMLDGWIPDYELPKSKRLKVIQLKETQGQRRAQNLGVKESNAEFVMKLDSHVSMSKDFDKIMIGIMKENPNIVLVPSFTNLWVYNWVCPKGHRTYQGKVDKCGQCEETKLEKELVWQNNTKIYSDFKFSEDLIFEYGDLENYEMLHEVKAIQGSGIMVSKENYFKWQLCDESWGSWGQAGVEMAIKVWNNGSKIMCTRRAFMGHFFRKENEFPYLRDMKSVDENYNRSKLLAKENAEIIKIKTGIIIE